MRGGTFYEEAGADRAVSSGCSCVNSLWFVNVCCGVGLEALAAEWSGAMKQRMPPAWACAAGWDKQDVEPRKRPCLGSGVAEMAFMEHSGMKPA